MIEAVTSGEAAGVLASRIEPDPEMIKRNFAILCDDDGRRVRRVIEKPRHTTSNLKGSGLYTFDLPVFDAVRRTPRTAMRDEYEITDTVQIMIDDGYTILHSPTVSEDINLTVPSDLLKINLLDLERRGLDHLIGPGACVDPGATIENSVIGAGVVVSQPIAIRDSLVFADVKLETGGDLRWMIVHEEGQIQC
jgi:dTDP-glucose pyrophosphorylase